MSNIPSVKFNSNSEDIIQNIFLGYIGNGYLLKKAYTKKKYFLFGPIKYYVEMEIGSIGYEILIQNAIESEDYLEVDRLQKELKHKKELKFIL